jgi:hypothetical protein
MLSKIGIFVGAALLLLGFHPSAGSPLVIGLGAAVVLLSLLPDGGSNDR